MPAEFLHGCYMSRITLTPCIAAHHAALAYRLLPAQGDYTRAPQEWFAAGGFRSGQYPVSILANAVPVGFFILDTGADKADYSDDPHALLLRSMSIHPAWQGRGIAALALAPPVLWAYIDRHIPAIRRIVLGVHHANVAAQRLYLRCGFHDTGRTYPGLKGLQYVFEQPRPA